VKPNRGYSLNVPQAASASCGRDRFPRFEVAQLVVDQRQQLRGSVRVALLDGRQDVSDVGLVGSDRPALKGRVYAAVAG
jgi:hypothetical protein